MKVMGEGGLISVHTVYMPKLSQHDMCLTPPPQNRLFLGHVGIKYLQLI